MDSGIGDLVGFTGAIAALLATLSLLLLLPLYLSQRRDVHRLREWMEEDPSHPSADLAASDSMLDRAETELEELLGEPGPATSAAARVSSERPALTRITMERAALAPHPRWRRFTARVTQPRAMLAIGAAAVLLGAAAIFGSEQLLSGGEDAAKQKRAGAIVPSEITVAVLNGDPSESGLAGKVASDLEGNGFAIGDVTNAPESSDQSIVLYTQGEQRAGEKVAQVLGIRAVQEIDRETRQRAGEADVVVIAGADRAGP